MRIDTLMREEIENELESLSKMELGSDQYKTTVDGITRLIDRAITMDHFEAELQEKIESRECDANIRLQQAKDDKTMRIIGHCISAAGIVLPLALTAWGTVKSLKFEETGTVTTLVGKGFLNKLLPKLK